MDERRKRALEHAREQGFVMSSDEDTGQLLAVLAAVVPPNGRILELGTGTGVGTSALIARDDIELITVELDPAISAVAQDNDWPASVTFMVGDAVELLPTLGLFDLIYADAQGGKWIGLDLTIAALAPRGQLLVDDMRVGDDWTVEHAGNQRGVRDALMSHPELAACEMDWSTGLILSTRV